MKILWNRHNISIFLILFLVGFAIALPVSAEQQMTLEDLVREVKLALLKVQQKIENNSLPPLETVKLEVNTVQSMIGDGKISFLIVELGSKTSKKVTNSVKLTLRPPPSDSSADVSASGISGALAESILAGARAVAIAKKGSPPLHAQELEATVKFAIEREGNGKLSIRFPPFEMGAGGSIAESAIQSITATYKYK
jgi:hypothetical protein